MRITSNYRESTESDPVYPVAKQTIREGEKLIVLFNKPESGTVIFQMERLL